MVSYMGESCGAVVVEMVDRAVNRSISPYAVISGWAIGMDGNCNPNPSYEGELQVINSAFKSAQISANEIDYINPYGTGSLIGDEIELKAIHDSHLPYAYINATKSITGHGLSAAGTVEIIASLLQMKSSRLYPTRNLEEPIEPDNNWVRNKAISHKIKNALSLSMGFGGINTEICLQKCND